MKHVTVYAEQGIYAGWPANHGAWQWGDEFLVGFLRGKYNSHASMHKIDQPFEKVQARSLDGGETWAVEKPNLDFEANSISAMPSFDITSSIIRVCGRYDHGGEYCNQMGGFYVSSDKGKSWSGAYGFGGVQETFLDPNHNTSRTCVIDNLVFLSAAIEKHWGSDWVFCVRHNGERFENVGTVCKDDARAVMPAAARIGTRLVVVARRRGSYRYGGWIDAFVSDDEGVSWSSPFHVAETGRDNGNPPALVEAQGRLFCALGNRTEKAIEVMTSENGEAWTGFKTLRKSSKRDIGYPRLFRRSDGQLVCVYYWADGRGDQQHIEATVFEV